MRPLFEGEKEKIGTFVIYAKVEKKEYMGLVDLLEEGKNPCLMGYDVDTFDKRMITFISEADAKEMGFRKVEK